MAIFKHDTAFGYKVKLTANGTDPPVIHPGKGETVHMDLTLDDDGSGNPLYKEDAIYFTLNAYVNDVHRASSATEGGGLEKIDSTHYSYDFKVDDCIQDNPDELKITLDGIHWELGHQAMPGDTIGDTAPATGEIVAGALGDPAVGCIHIDGWADSEGINRAMTVGDGKELYFHRDTTISSDLRAESAGDAKIIVSSNGDIPEINITIASGGSLTIADGGRMFNLTTEDLKRDLIVDMDGAVSIIGGSLSMSNLIVNLGGKVAVSGGSLSMTGEIVDRNELFVTNNGSLSASNLTVREQASLAISGGEVNITGGSPKSTLTIASLGNVKLSGGTLAADEITGSGTDNGTLDWSGGTILSAPSSESSDRPFTEMVIPEGKEIKRSAAADEKGRYTWTLEPVGA